MKKWVALLIITLILSGCEVTSGGDQRLCTFVLIAICILLVVLAACFAWDAKLPLR